MRTFEEFIEGGMAVDVDVLNGRCRTTDGVKRISQLPAHVVRPIALRVVEPLPETGYERPLSFGVAQNAQRIAEGVRPVLRLVTGE